MSVGFTEAPDTNRSAGLHSFAAVATNGAARGWSSLPAAGLTCEFHLRTQVYGEELVGSWVGFRLASRPARWALPLASRPA